MVNNRDIPWYSEEAGLFGEVYLRTFGDLITEEQTQIETNFLETSLKLQPGVKIFDLCCGHGRHSVELAKRGYNVTGQDLNSHFLTVAKESADKAGVNITWIKDDMRNIAFENEFDVVINMFTAFGYLGSDEEDQKVINGVYRALTNGGRFIIDIANRDNIIRNYLWKDHKYHNDGTLEIIDRKFDHIFGGHYETRKMFFPEGTIKEFDALIRFYSVTELIAMMKKAGLEFVESYGDFDGSKISFSSPNYLLIGQK